MQINPKAIWTLKNSGLDVEPESRRQGFQRKRKKGKMKVKFMNKVAACAVGLVLASVASSNAVLTLTLTSGTSTVSVTDGDGDGIVFISGSLVGGWSGAINSALTKPYLGTPTAPRMDVSFTDLQLSGAGQSLTITAYDDAYGPLTFKNGTAVLTGGIGSSLPAEVIASGLVNGKVVVSMSSVTPIAHTAFGSASGLDSTFTMGETIVIAPSAVGNLISGDVQLSVVPEPGTILAGVLLLLPFGASALRIIRKKRE